MVLEKNKAWDFPVPPLWGRRALRPGETKKRPSILKKLQNYRKSHNTDGNRVRASARLRVKLLSFKGLFHLVDRELLNACFPTSKKDCTHIWTPSTNRFWSLPKHVDSSRFPSSSSYKERENECPRFILPDFGFFQFRGSIHRMCGSLGAPSIYGVSLKRKRV